MSLRLLLTVGLCAVVSARDFANRIGMLSHVVRDM